MKSKKLPLIIILTFGLFILSAGWMHSVRAITETEKNTSITFYVSPEGNDAWSGTSPEPNNQRTDGPFATLYCARGAVRELKRAGLSKPVNVVVREGTYYLPDPLEFGPEDSGTKDFPITYKAYANEHVVLSGGKPITNWKSYAGNIYVANVSNVHDDNWHFRQLFVDNRREVRARYPNFDLSDPLHKGWLYAQAPVGYGLILSGLRSYGDFLEHQFSIQTQGTYHLWVGYATIFQSQHEDWAVAVDGVIVENEVMPPSGSFREIIWKRVATVQLNVGEHILRWEKTDTPDNIVHFDAFVFSTNAVAEPTQDGFPTPGQNEHQIVIHAESPKSKIAGKASHMGGFQTIACAEKFLPLRKIFCRPNEIKQSWALAPSPELQIFAGWGWFNEIVHLNSVDLENGIIEIGGNECQYRIREGNRFFVEGMMEELDQAGEWHFNRNTGQLYYWPRANHPNDSIIIAPVLTTILQLRTDVEGEERVQYINFQGFTFAHTDYTIDHVSVRTAQDAAVILENSWHCSIENNTFYNIGGSAIRLHLDCQYNHIAHNDISDVGGSGVLLTAAYVDRGLLMTPGEEAAKYAPIRNTITRNHISDCGKMHKYAAGIHIDSRPKTMANICGNHVSYNVIFDMPRVGIFAFQNQGGNVFEHNIIYNVMLESDDGGGIHICQDNVHCAPTEIQNNVIHDVQGMRVGIGQSERKIGVGIYLDCQSSQSLIQKNLIYRTSYGGVFLNSGNNNVIENNIIVDSGSQQLWVSNYSKEMAGNHLRRNILSYTENDALAFQLRHFTDVTFAESDWNLFWHNGQSVIIELVEDETRKKTFEEWQTLGFDPHSIVADPLFIDPENDNFCLRNTSPAYNLGFESFDKIPPIIGMIAYWKFDEESGKTANDSVGANHGTIYGATRAIGQVNSALSFDGVDDYVEIPYDATLNDYPPLTVESWVRISDFSSKHPIIINKGQSWAQAINHDMHYKVGIAGASPSEIYSPNVLPLNTWHHLAFTYDGITIKLFENGVEVVSQAVTGSPRKDSYSLVIGGNSPDPYSPGDWGLPYLFPGLIDEVAIYNKALSAEEIQQHYQNALNGLGYGMTVSSDIALPAGWAMISLPVGPSDKKLNAIFPEAVVVYGYEKGTGYVRVKPDEDLEVGKGYWILLNEAQTYALTGECIQEYTLSVENGWYMIGGCTDPARVIPHGCGICAIYGYDKGVGYQQVLESEYLAPGKGHWICIKDATDGATISVTVD